MTQINSQRIEPLFQWSFYHRVPALAAAILFLRSSLANAIFAAFSSLVITPPVPVRAGELGVAGLESMIDSANEAGGGGEATDVGGEGTATEVSGRIGA